MNNKIKVLLTILISLFILPVISFAQTTVEKKIYKVELSFEYTIAGTTVSVSHSGIERVSVNMRTLVAAGNITLEGSGTLANMYIEYHTMLDDTIQRAGVSYASSKGQEYSFITDPVVVPSASSEREDTVYYRIVAQTNDGSWGYYPSSTTYQTAELNTVSKKSIDTSGGMLIQQSGDHTKGDSNIIFSNNALLQSGDFSIEELYSDSYSNRSKIHNYTSEGINPVITYDFTLDNSRFISITDQSKMPAITLYYGDLPKNINEITVKWLNDAGKWVDVAFSNDTDKRIVTVSLAQTGTKLGFYAVFDKIDYSDNDYRPEYTLFTPGEMLEFRHLRDGDSVTILNMRSQVVKNITSAPFEWDGKDSSGNYVETGLYLYQIKVNGKVISGMTTFAK